jgi:hypothetical protein
MVSLSVPENLRSEQLLDGEPVDPSRDTAGAVKIHNELSA